VLRDFDLAAANSGGGLVLGGLVEDLSLGDLEEYFLDEAKRKSIFSPTRSWLDRSLNRVTGIGPKYSTRNKLPAIEALIPTTGRLPLPRAVAGVRRESAAKDIHLLIIGFDYDRDRARFFRSAQANGGPGLGEGAPAGVTLAEAIHASANPPVDYFDAPATFPHRPGRYWDGGVTGYNNPILAAVTEARALGVAASDIAGLSVGTGSVVLPLRARREAPSPLTVAPAKSWLVPDIRKLATAILDDPTDDASYIAHVMTGAARPSRIVRMNPLVSPLGEPGRWTKPDGMTDGEFAYLANLPMDAVEQSQVDAIAKFADLWLSGDVRNQPIRMNGDTLACELGSPFFADARAAWLAIAT
jgi:Patatin-like phospholipase